ncbi:MAG: alpha/beta fold hydrolase [Pseudomonadota bacterium]|nr:alpha/beta fold hydrolase [Pseudomonadota bacterium]
MIDARGFSVQGKDGHDWLLPARIPDNPNATLLWLPALGVAARHYLPFAEALAAHGIAVFVHEWRGNGSSNTRADRNRDWGYRELLTLDVPASEAAVADAFAQLPRIIGGHSLGGQLALCHLALSPPAAQALWLVATGSPYWRAFPAPLRFGLPLVYRFLPWLARQRGALPGRLIGFGGNEASTLIVDWARTALSGRYTAHGISTDLEAAMARIDVATRAVVLSDDWLAPDSSLRFLLSKLSRSSAEILTLDAHDLGVAADHFTWMQRPHAIAHSLAERAA